MNLDALFARRSIRKFTDKPVLEADINIMIKAAMSAPSANNLQPWHLVVVTDRAVLNSLADAHPYGKMLFQATLGIAVCGDPEISDAYWIQDCSAATQNILIAATSLGLGSVWLGCTPRETRVKAVQEILKIPPRFPVLSLIAIGYPDEKKPPHSDLDKTKLHRDQW
jgi:nitroreductase